MKLSEHLAKFDPLDRVKEARFMNVLFNPVDWMRMEKHYGKRISPTEIHDLIMGVFVGSHKIVKR